MKENLFKVSVWSKPLNEEYILQNLDKFKIPELLFWQTHLPEEFRKKLRLLEKFSI